MNFTTIDYQGTSSIYLIDNFFPQDLVENIFSIFDNVNDTDWPDTDVFSHRSGRRLYQGNGPVVNSIMYYAGSNDTIKFINSMVGNSVAFSGVSLWADFPGYTITPHYDPDFFDYAVQIYITRDANAWNGPVLGTTIYETANKILCQLPYRNNFGYFFQQPNRVLHGLGTPVPDGMQRNSVYLRYNRA